MAQDLDSGAILRWRGGPDRLAWKQQMWDPVVSRPESCHNLGTMLCRLVPRGRERARHSRMLEADCIRSEL